MTATTSIVNAAPLYDTIQPYILAVVTVLTGWAVNGLNKWLAAHKASMAQDDLDQALQHVPTLAAAFLSSLGAHNQNISVPSAIASVAQTIINTIPAQVKTLNLSPETVQSYVAAKMDSPAPAAAPMPAAPVTTTKGA